MKFYNTIVKKQCNSKHAIQTLTESYQFRLHRPWLLAVDCWVLRVDGRVEKLNGWVLTVDLNSGSIGINITQSQDTAWP